MPLYEYACRSCARQFEELVFGRAQPVCPACQSADVERLLSVVAVGRAEARASAASSPMPAGACGSCGDPRGPGACAIDKN
jgi:putative FmdB family regulatory protein